MLLLHYAPSDSAVVRTMDLQHVQHVVAVCTQSLRRRDSQLPPQLVLLLVHLNRHDYASHPHLSFQPRWMQFFIDEVIDEHAGLPGLCQLLLPSHVNSQPPHKQAAVPSHHLRNVLATANVTAQLLKHGCAQRAVQRLSAVARSSLSNDAKVQWLADAQEFVRSAFDRWLNPEAAMEQRICELVIALSVASPEDNGPTVRRLLLDPSDVTPDRKNLLFRQLGVPKGSMRMALLRALHESVSHHFALVLAQLSVNGGLSLHLENGKRNELWITIMCSKLFEQQLLYGDCSPQMTQLHLQYDFQARYPFSTHIYRCLQACETVGGGADVAASRRVMEESVLRGFCATFHSLERAAAYASDAAYLCESLARALSAACSDIQRLIGLLVLHWAIHIARLQSVTAETGKWEETTLAVLRHSHIHAAIRQLNELLRRLLQLLAGLSPDQRAALVQPWLGVLRVCPFSKTFVDLREKKPVTAPILPLLSAILSSLVAALELMRARTHAASSSSDARQLALHTFCGLGTAFPEAAVTIVRVWNLHANVDTPAYVNFQQGDFVFPPQPIPLHEVARQLTSRCRSLHVHLLLAPQLLLRAHEWSVAPLASDEGGEEAARADQAALAAWTRLCKLRFDSFMKVAADGDHGGSLYGLLNALRPLVGKCSPLPLVQLARDFLQTYLTHVLPTGPDCDHEAQLRWDDEEWSVEMERAVWLLLAATHAGNTIPFIDDYRKLPAKAQVAPLLNLHVQQRVVAKLLSLPDCSKHLQSLIEPIWLAQLPSISSSPEVHVSREESNLLLVTTQSLVARYPWNSTWVQNAVRGLGDSPSPYALIVALQSCLTRAATLLQRGTPASSPVAQKTDALICAGLQRLSDLIEHLPVFTQRQENASVDDVSLLRFLLDVYLVHELQRLHVVSSAHILWLLDTFRPRTQDDHWLQRGGSVLVSKPSDTAFHDDALGNPVAVCVESDMSLFGRVVQQLRTNGSNSAIEHELQDHPRAQVIVAHALLRIFYLERMVTVSVANAEETAGPRKDPDSEHVHSALTMRRYQTPQIAAAKAGQSAAAAAVAACTPRCHPFLHPNLRAVLTTVLAIPASGSASARPAAASFARPVAADDATCLTLLHGHAEAATAQPLRLGGATSSLQGVPNIRVAILNVMTFWLAAGRPTSADAPKVGIYSHMLDRFLSVQRNGPSELTFPPVLSSVLGFLPGMFDNALELERAAAGPCSQWCCACGRIYYVPNCGMPKGTSKCACGLDRGGTITFRLLSTAAPGQQKLHWNGSKAAAQPGYVWCGAYASAGRPENLYHKDLPVRHLSPFATLTANQLVEF